MQLFLPSIIYVARERLKAILKAKTIKMIKNNPILELITNISLFSDLGVVHEELLFERLLHNCKFHLIFQKDPPAVNFINTIRIRAVIKNDIIF